MFIGQRLILAGWLAIPISSMRHCFFGCTSILFEGKPVGTPDAGVFWRVISEHKVKALFTAPPPFGRLNALILMVYF
jgi:acyl-coenzyme A synthetase/AMP-(fatty) acid ligase